MTTKIRGEAELPMRVDRRDVLKMSAASLALVASADLAGSVVAGTAAPAGAMPASGLSTYDATGLAELIRTKQITPAEAVDDAIRKIEAINPTLNAVIWKHYEAARARAARGVIDAPFAGVPLLVKDKRPFQ